MKFINKIIDSITWYDIFIMIKCIIMTVIFFVTFALYTIIEVFTRFKIFGAESLTLPSNIWVYNLVWVPILVITILHEKHRLRLERYEI